ncbi:MAG: deoxyguanosinetriphosphate triphosphohydrolase [Faecalicatena sp.]|uniref:deoxyguanosinetriphosphate triphosphohydrolase n=1 Tax=Faecalicatena sp. TaxID=2005360 RepID=UPI0025846BC3|nr:deoxyguanosinetriphosphate triphosphohydrolase [Faecalicatena sp.]MCI6467592.1 deoxyguanosinetriphosphate triphosphohydrolase [Faecalicatena sp.]MDY5619768.1 deoxyguanosinetriphosphate triphosphohydrolase [Lachnospiraceae bacterium]
MEWNTLLSTQRMRGGANKKGKPVDLRSEFEKDYHRIIGSASFRRLQDKTQVFPLDKSDFIRTRLTHSLEVSSFGKSLGQNIGENILSNRKDPGFTLQMKEDICHILQCAGLIHDIGNPPFGHFGEDAIREWFTRHLPELDFFGTPVEELLTPQMREDFYHFEGNAQALRLVTKLHYLVDENGMNLTYALLNTIVKYPVASTGIDKTTGNIKDKKMGYYYADQNIFEEIVSSTGAGKNRHPLTYILEAADDLAYKTADIEDAFVKGFISYHDLEKELEGLQSSFTDLSFDALGKLRTLYERGKEKQADNPEAYAVKNWIVRVQGFLISCATSGFTSNYESIMAGTFKHDIFHGTFGEKLMDLLGDMAYRYVFSSTAIYKMEVTEAVILDFLMDKLVHAVLYYDTDAKMNSIDSRVVSFISENYKNAYKYQAGGKSEAEKLYLRLLLVTDYVCGMTDSYAKRLYQEMNGLV